MATSSRTWYRNSQKYLDIKSQGAGSYDLELLYVECWRNFQDFFYAGFLETARRCDGTRLGGVLFCELNLVPVTARQPS